MGGTRAGAEAGFSLIEVMVALAVFAIAVVALLNVQGEAASAASRLEDKALARIVAENRLVDLMSRPEALAPGTASGEVEMGGRDWVWRQSVTGTADEEIVRLEIVVSGPDSDREIASAVAFRRVQ